MKHRIIKQIIFAILMFCIPKLSNAQSMVTEISWNMYNQNYTGLLVLYPNNRGIFKVKTYNASVGWVWIQQDAVLTNQYDIYGNCTSYINCYNPKTNPYIPYAADNFLVYPNGAIYTQDSAGNWSTQIVAMVVPDYNWQYKFNEYGIK